MKAPYVSLENAAEVTEYFSHAMPVRPVTRGIHFLSGMLIKGTTLYVGNAQKMISEDLTKGHQLFVAHNHQCNWDPFELASIIEHEKIFRQMRNRVTIPGKPALFNHPLYGWIVRRSGGVPVFRIQDPDFENVDDPLIHAERRSANDSLIDILIAKMNNGLHGAIYPEGERAIKKQRRGEHVDFSRLQEPLHAGIGRIACGVEDPDNLRLLCVGTAYGFHHDQKLHPTSVISEPFPVADSPTEVVDQTRENLQFALTAAHEMTRIIR